ncbi:MAG: hypothetical protein D6721_06645 [Gammaproteobacteria bacterium]|nr:MAG: hypothetical protein D6721_06645 [Gammaproteobacteria bacterium]
MREENKQEHPGNGEDAVPGGGEAARGATRRQVLRSAAAAAPVLMSVTGRPALAAAQCTVSGMLSGNLSGPHRTCEGCSPGYWKQEQHFHNWQAPYRPKAEHGQPASRWTEYFPALPGMGGSGGLPSDLTLLDALRLHGNTQAEALARQAVAALLNGAYQRATGGMNFGYTDGDVIDLYRQLLDDPQVSLEDMADLFEMLNERHCPLG